MQLTTKKQQLVSGFSNNCPTTQTTLPAVTLMLEHHWYIACEIKSIARKPHAFSAFNKRLVAFRGSDGKVAVLDDRCAHRNAPLSAGFVDGNLLRCPYHGWGYNSDGVAEDIPACPSQAPAASKPCIKSWSAIEQDGYVWFSLTDQPATERPMPFAHINESGWTTFTMKTRFAGSVESCLENFLDCPHATFVHNFWFRKPTAKAVHAKVNATSDGAVASYFDEPREGSVVWKFLSRSKSTMEHTDRFIAPATTKVDYIFSDKRHYIITSSCTPVSESETCVYTAITFRFGKIGWFIRLFFEPLSRWIIRQDVDMVALQQKNLEHFGSKHYNIIEQDLLFKHITNWRRSIEKGTPSPTINEPKNIELRL